MPYSLNRDWRIHLFLGLLSIYPDQYPDYFYESEYTMPQLRKPRKRIVDEPYFDENTKPNLPVVRESDRAWASAETLESDGLAYPVLIEVETWLLRLGLDSHVVRHHRGTKSRILYLRGDCFFCKRPHEHNHWVLINTDGFSTTRIRCHDTGRTGAVSRFGF